VSDSGKDRQVLRELARQVAEIAALPQQQETIRLWKALNGLRPVRPMVMIDQIPWHEMDVNGELAPACEDEFCRKIETRLRRTLYSWKHMRADMVVEPFVDLPKAISGWDFGIHTVDERAVSDPQNDVVGHGYVDQVKTEEDVEKIHTPRIQHDPDATARARSRAEDLLGDLLQVRMCGAGAAFPAWDLIVMWHGPGNVLLDLADRPEFMHKLMGRVTDAYHGMLDQLEAQGLLTAGQSTIHCTGAWTDELPAAGFDPQRPRAKDIWTFGMAQIFSTVSPRMHQEFELAYAERWYRRFGLVYYGCCEPLHDKIDLIRKMPHVRKISISPWADVVKAAERIGRDYVLSRKPSPALLARDSWDPRLVESDLGQTLTECARHGCPVELILKDISTVRYQPQRLWEWADLAMRLVNG
jgi:hypothetical protein